MTLSERKEDCFNPLDILRWHAAIRLHFTSKSYCCISQNYKVKHITLAKFNQNKHKDIYQKLSSSFITPSQVRLFLVTCYMNDYKTATDIKFNYNNCKDLYNRSRKVIQSLDYIFETDIKKLRKKYNNFKETILCDDTIPNLILDSVNKEINLETIIILDHIYGIISIIDQQCKEELFWPKYRDKLINYKSFFTNHNPDHYKAILHMHFKKV